MAGTKLDIGQSATQNVLSRAIVKDSKGGVRVDGVDFDATLVPELLYTVAETADRLDQKKKGETIELASGMNAVETIEQALKNPRLILRR